MRFLMKMSALQVLVFASSASAVTLAHIDRGWYQEDGLHNAAQETALVGHVAGLEYRSFFVFDLMAVNQPVTSATLRLEHFQGGAGLHFDVFDVATPVNLLRSSHAAAAAGQLVFDDLGSGDAYTIDVFADLSTVGTVLEIPLNNDAVAAINSALGGLFAVGLSAQEATGYVSFSNNAESRTHELVLGFDSPAIPEPTTVLLWLLMCAASRRRWRLAR